MTYIDMLRYGGVGGEEREILFKELEGLERLIDGLDNMEYG